MRVRSCGCASRSLLLWMPTSRCLGLANARESNLLQAAHHASCASAPCHTGCPAPCCCSRHWKALASGPALVRLCRMLCSVRLVRACAPPERCPNRHNRLARQRAPTRRVPRNEPPDAPAHCRLRPFRGGRQTREKYQGPRTRAGSARGRPSACRPRCACAGAAPKVATTGLRAESARVLSRTLAARKSRVKPEHASAISRWADLDLVRPREEPSMRSIPT